MPKPPLPQHLDEFLEQANPSVIGAVDAEGAPHTAATWYLWEDGRVLVNMAESRARLDNVRRDERVSLTVLDEASWYNHVSLRGRVVSISDDEDFSGIDRLSNHYMGSDYGFRGEGRVNAWIEVDAWHAWKGGSPWR